VIVWGSVFGTPENGMKDSELPSADGGVAVPSDERLVSGSSPDPFRQEKNTHDRHYSAPTCIYMFPIDPMSCIHVTSFRNM